MKTVFLTLLLLLPLSLAAYDFEDCGYYYSFNTDRQSVKLTYNRDLEESYTDYNLFIPGTVYYNKKYYPVTGIGGYALHGCNQVHYVTVDENIVTIDEHAFEGCQNLRGIDLPEGLKSIGFLSFGGCWYLSEIFFPSTLETIADEAFECCSNLPVVHISDAVTSIGERAFYACWSMDTLSIGRSVSYIGPSAFESCFKIISLKVNPDNTTFDSRDDCNAIIETATNKLIAGCLRTVIPESVTAIGDDAFNLLYSSTSNEYRPVSMTIPASVVSIGRNAFDACDRLDSVTCLATTPPAMYASSFSCYNRATLYVPAASLAAYQSDENWSKFVNIVPLDADENSGDINGDGKLSITDVTSLIGLILNGDDVLSGNPAADVNGDGKVNIVDVTALVDILLTTE